MIRAFVTSFVVAITATSAMAADLAVKAPPPPWTWNGLYAGVHFGAVVPGIAHFSDPFGNPLYGDRVRTPGWLAGGQIGHNWQAANSPWVFGVEADVSGMDSDGTRTCFAVSGDAINTTCRVRPQVSGTLTGRVGYAAGPQGRALVYVKGGFAWAYDRIDMAINNSMDPPGNTTPPVTSNSSYRTMWGGTAGAGVEYAMTPAWSFVLEYDYLAFARSDVANLGSVTAASTGAILAVTPAGSAGLDQDLHRVKIGLNYRWGADPWAIWPAAVPALGVASGKTPIYKAPPAAAWAPGWEFEVGTRYVGHQSRFQDDLGRDRTAGTPISAISRLTYKATDSDSGEVFGRVDTPWNWFLKGFAGRGKIRDGFQHDEDFGVSSRIPDSDPAAYAYVPYTNTIASKVDGRIKYGTVDVGYSWWRGADYKAGAFVGYNYYEQQMHAHGCAQIANPNNMNCIPAQPVSQPGGIKQATKWKSLRLGVGGEFVPYDRIKLSGEVAYLPYVQFDGLDIHLFGGTGALSSVNPDKAHGRGVQLEGLVSYLITPNFSVGVGARYWAMWTNPTGVARRTIDCNGSDTVPEGECVISNSAPNFMKGAVEQASVFVQASVKLDSIQAFTAGR